MNTFQNQKHIEWVQQIDFQWWLGIKGHQK